MTAGDVTLQAGKERALSFTNWSALGKFFGITVQLGLIVLVIREFQLESTAFTYLAMLTLCGFVIHANLPLRYRMPFFVLLSLTGIGVVLGPQTAAWLVGIGLLLIGICHLPIPFLARIATLVLVGAGLLTLRVDALQYPWSKAVWPILGSMFMFRLIIYLYDLRHAKTRPTLASTLSYFFLLPNVAFPLFPVVDYHTFRRTYYSEDEYKIYQKGVEWIFRGITHLILYRFVYYYLSIAPEEIQNAGDLARFLVTNYLLYLRVSGHFHIVVGMLHLFGFNLPETHHLYYLASSFTDYWRRINIYWKDFMMKIFYYPSFFGLRRFGTTTALVLSTFLVFLATMLLHSYQWFWIRGAFPLPLQDVVFWSILAVLVATNAVWEAKKGRKRTLGKKRVTVGLVLRTAVTFTVICVLWSLWTSSSVSDWLAMWSAAGNGFAFDLKRWAPTVLVLGAAFATAGPPRRSEDRRDASSDSKLRTLRRSAVVTGASILALYVVAHPRVYARFDSSISGVIRSLQESQLNRQDQALLERGYYEDLLGVDRFNMELWSRYTKTPTDWANLWQTDAVRWTGDLLRLELKPSVEIQFKGKALHTNSWGMRDREYAKAKAPGTFRIAVLGSSPVMGSGIADDEIFEQIVEDSLNAVPPFGPYAHFEILNFAVDGYTVLQQVMVLDQKALSFGPDAVFYVAHETEAEKTIGQLATLLEDGTPIPYPELREIADRAGVRPGTRRLVGVRDLTPYANEILLWAYRRIAADARAHGVLPVWVFMPMPARGAGAPCQKGRASMCFGSTARAGAVADEADPRVATLFQLAHEAGLTILNLSSAYDDQDLSTLWVAEWDSHPNAKAQRLVAHRLTQLLTDGTNPVSQLLFTGQAKDNGTTDGGE